MEKFTISHITHQEVHRMDYKRQILELLQSITDEKILRRIYLMILTIIGAGR